MPQGETPTRDPSRRLNKLECGSKSVGLSSGLAVYVVFLGKIPDFRNGSVYPGRMGGNPVKS